MFKLWLVEDNANYRRSLKDRLHMQFPSMVIGEGGNANEALRKAHAFVPDVFLMDIGLCGESELEVTRRIKRHFLGITVILLTGYDLPEYRDAGFECGATHFIIKDSLI